VLAESVLANMGSAAGKSKYKRSMGNYCAVEPLWSRILVNFAGKFTPDDSQKEDQMKKLVVTSLLALGLTLTLAEAKEGIKVGLLSCGIDGGVGFIIGSSKAINCVYHPSGGGRTERYQGSIDKLGIDIGVTKHSEVAWAVFAPGKIKRGALEGGYGGASAEVTVVGGLGANVLVGGFDKSINLQPVSIQAQTGLNIAAGIAALRLEYVK
jgi:hypothetical protein